MKPRRTGEQVAAGKEGKLGPKPGPPAEMRREAMTARCHRKAGCADMTAGDVKRLKMLAEEKRGLKRTGRR